jgi:pimeloyl-ACP methyl ester carboxylesterase
MADVGELDLARLNSNVDRIVNRLAARSRVAVFDYPRGLGRTTGPYPGDLTVSTVIDDYLAVADAAGIAEFALLGYSWSASAAIEIAARTSRCAALVIGGWPPLDPPHRELRDACEALAADPRDGRSRLAGMYARYYQSVLDGRRSTGLGTDIPAVLFYGTDDTEAMAGGSGSVAELVSRNRHSLVAQGWRLVTVPGRDHAGCLSADVVLPLALSVVAELSDGARR